MELTTQEMLALEKTIAETHATMQQQFAEVELVLAGGGSGDISLG